MNATFRFVNTKGTSFWAINFHGRTCLVSWGRVGAVPRTKRFTFPTKAEAVEFLDNQLTKRYERTPYHAAN